MNILYTILVILLAISISNAQTDAPNYQIEKACLNYLEGFYKGDTTKIIASIKPTLHKFGYWKNDQSGEYMEEGYMTYQQAIDYARGVSENKRFAKADAPKKIEVLDVSNHIASAKITAWWGIDYVLLTRYKDKWMIEQVLWEGPLER